MSSEKWNIIRNDLLQTYKYINTKNVDATILGLLNEAENLQLAKNYISFLYAEDLKPNTATLGRLVRVYNAVYHEKGELSDAEENEVLKLCDQMRANHDLLDSITCEHVIHGLVTTKTRWKEALDLFEMFKITAVPSVAVYTQLILKAFSSNEMQLGLDLLDELVSQNRQPKCDIFIKFLSVVSQNTETFTENFLLMLKFLEKHQLMLTQKVASYIDNLAKDIQNIGYSVSMANVNPMGKCSNCSQFLKNVAILEDEYEQLRDSFLQKVLIRNDVFQKSTPEEVERFKNFVDETAPYDCVIDGLNVAYSKGAKRSLKDIADLLASVVQYFDKRGKNVLVLGRKHMNSWPKIAMNNIRKNARLFLTNNLTHDDPFMLYATLKSGQMTDFFSRDLMRSHAHLLGPELKLIFRRWQQEHQYSLITQTHTGKVLIKEPIRHLIYTHQVNDTWHVPLIAEYAPQLPENFDAPSSWLCINFKS